MFSRALVLSGALTWASVLQAATLVVDLAGGADYRHWGSVSYSAHRYA